MRVLEQRIMESGEASVASASLVDMQQVTILHRHFIIVFIFLMIFTTKSIRVHCYQQTDSQLSIFFPWEQQTVMKLMTQCSEKGFELEVSSIYFLYTVYLQI